MKPFSLNRGRGVANIHLGSPELKLYKKDPDYYIKKDMAQSLYVIIGLKTAVFLLKFITFSALTVLTVVVVQLAGIVPDNNVNRNAAKVKVVIKYRNEPKSPVTTPEIKKAEAPPKKELVKKEIKKKKTIKPKLKKSKLTKKPKKQKVKKPMRPKDKPPDINQTEIPKAAAIKPYQPDSKKKQSNFTGNNSI